MLIYELNCEGGHSFEGWFENLEDLRRQLAQNQINCPVCGSFKISQVPSAFAIAKKGLSGDASARDEQQAARAMEQALHHFFTNNFEDVGTTFFSEALKIHYGAAPARNIRGVSTDQEEKILRQEGVDFFKFSGNDSDSPPVSKPRKASH